MHKPDLRGIVLFHRDAQGNIGLDTCPIRDLGLAFGANTTGESQGVVRKFSADHLFSMILTAARCEMRSTGHEKEFPGLAL